MVSTDVSLPLTNSEMTNGSHTPAHAIYDDTVIGNDSGAHTQYSTSESNEVVGVDSMAGVLTEGSNLELGPSYSFLIPPPSSSPNSPPSKFSPSLPRSATPSSSNVIDHLKQEQDVETECELASGQNGSTDYVDKGQFSEDANGLEAEAKGEEEEERVWEQDRELERGGERRKDLKGDEGKEEDGKGEKRGEERGEEKEEGRESERRGEWGGDGSVERDSLADSSERQWNRIVWRGEGGEAKAAQKEWSEIRHDSRRIDRFAEQRTRHRTHWREEEGGEDPPRKRRRFEFCQGSGVDLPANVAGRREWKYERRPYGEELRRERGGREERGKWGDESEGYGGGHREEGGGEGEEGMEVEVESAMSVNREVSPHTQDTGLLPTPHMDMAHTPIVSRLPHAEYPSFSKRPTSMQGPGGVTYLSVAHATHAQTLPPLSFRGVGSGQRSGGVYRMSSGGRERESGREREREKAEEGERGREKEKEREMSVVFILMSKCEFHISID